MARKQIRVWGRDPLYKKSQNGNGFPKRNKMRLGSVSRRMLFTCLLLAGFILLFAPHNLTNKFQLAFARVFRWPLRIGRGISLAARAPQSPGEAFSRKESLYQNHIANLIAQRDQAYQEIQKLSGLRNRFPLTGAKLMIADVITASIDRLHSELIINRGENDGLAKGQLVLGDNSIIGTISDVSSRMAVVKLITDSASKIAVKIAELNVDRLMQGAGGDSAKVQLLSTKHKVKVGDVVLARKRPGFLDTPMIIGTVAQCKRDDENPSLWDITVEPACDLKRISNVAVIIMNPRDW